MSEPLLASSPWGFRQTPIIEQCRWLKEHGFKHIGGQFAGFPGAFDIQMSDEQIRQALELVRGFGLNYASFNADGDFMVRERVEDQVAICCHAIDRAARFQPKVIIVFAGWQPIQSDQIYGQVSASLKTVAQHAAKYRLPVALENHGGLTARAQQINRILDAVGEPNLGVNYDPANFLMYGEDPLKEFLAIRHPIYFTHFKSVKMVDGKKVYCRLNQGMIDYQTILKAVAERYRGFYAIEYEETSDVMAGSQDDLEFLKQQMVSVGLFTK